MLGTSVKLENQAMAGSCPRWISIKTSVGVYFPEKVKAKSVILPEVDSYHLLKTL